ncbi:MAG: hypothetical protein RDU83_13905 [bacterium]|nr:hypothetical protein [bacterium]
MSPDPAASYRRFTPRQRAQAEARFSREAVAVRARVEADRTAAAIAANLARSRKTLQAAELVLRQGTLKGSPLTPSLRREVESIAKDARKMIAEIAVAAGLETYTWNLPQLVEAALGA